MKDYKSYPRKYIGESDVASLILAGYKKGVGVTSDVLKFGCDDAYNRKQFRQT